MTAVTTTHPEAFRPALHYTARNTWLNDPNGLIHHQGVYHLYYQNNPFGNTWGNCPGATPRRRTSPTGPNNLSRLPATSRRTSSPAASYSTAKTAAGSAPKRRPRWWPFTPAPTRKLRRCAASRRSHWPTVWTAASLGKNTRAIPCSAATRPTSVTQKFSATTAGPAPTG